MYRTTITLGEKEWRLIREYCTKNYLKISGFLCNSAIEKINVENKKPISVKNKGGKP